MWFKRKKEQQTEEQQTKRKGIGIGKRIVAGCGVLAIASCMALGVSATDGETSSADVTTTIANSMTSSFSDMKNDIGTYAKVVVPPALGVFAITFGIHKGKKVFNTLSK